jgi:hypothetical protein
VTQPDLTRLEAVCMYVMCRLPGSRAVMTTGQSRRRAVTNGPPTEAGAQHMPTDPKGRHPGAKTSPRAMAASGEGARAGWFPGRWGCGR